MIATHFYLHLLSLENLFMKKTLLLLVISIVLQSCFSYKAVENNSSQYEIGKTYKLKRGKKSEEVKIISKTDSTIVVKHKFQEKEVLLSTISNTKKRKFSYIKTLIFPPLTLAVIIAIAASSVQVKTGGIQSPP